MHATPSRSLFLLLGGGPAIVFSLTLSYRAACVGISIFGNLRRCESNAFKWYHRYVHICMHVLYSCQLPAVYAVYMCGQWFIVNACAIHINELTGYRFYGI
jgi:hypothetical protein